MIEFIAKGPARIVLMPLGGYKEADWEAFSKAAAAHPELLLILSAGNDGRDIDADPVYPAALKLDNAIVVTSSDAFGRIAPGSNWGAEAVDLAVPGERIEVIDHNGVRTGLPAQAMRLRGSQPLQRAWRNCIRMGSQGTETGNPRSCFPLPRERTPKVKHGWIANPALEAPVE